MPLSDRNADRWCKCSYSGRLPEYEERDEVKIVQELAVAVLTGQEPPSDITDEMSEGVNMLAEAVNEELAGRTIKYGVAGEELKWEKVSVLPTAYFIDSDNTVSIFRLEWSHSFVDHFESKRMVLAAAAIVKQHQLHNPTFRMFTVQPRCYEDKPVRKWMRLYEALGTMEHEIARCVKAVTDEVGKATRCSGTHCRYCPAMLKCIANRRAAQNAISVSLIQYDDSGIDDLELEYDAMKMAAQILSDRIAAVETRVIHSERLPRGFAHSQSRGRTAWKNDQEAINTGKLFGVDISKPGVKTPKQAVSAGLNEQVVKSLTVHKSKTVIKRITPRHIREALQQ